MLKLYGQVYIGGQNDAAAFGRLCVETVQREHLESLLEPAAFRRLYIEILSKQATLLLILPSPRL